ncbi:MAG: potassium channel protein [Desulfovibrionaceae bacterium]|nr:potassium channel protein [Desulfovibrionaceae bacterium]
MKFLSAQFSLFLRERGVRRNINAFVRFLIVLLVMIAVYSALFHALMQYEGRSYSWVTGLYWTLTVMSTLGFGDITFSSDPGRVFSVVVLLSGVLCLLVMLPFAFIQYVYSPWLEAQKKGQTPRSLPEGARGHILLVGLGPVTLNLADDLARYGFDSVLLCPDTSTTLDLLDQGYHAVMGDYDDSATYRRLRLADAAMLVALDDDVRNTNVAFSAREAAPDVPIVARAGKQESMDILELAGCSHVYRFRKLLGEALASRVLVGGTRAGLLTSFGPLVITEALVARTHLLGKTLRESGLRDSLGINVVGLWQRGQFRLPTPDTPLEENTVLIMAGTQEQMEAFDRRMGDGEPASAAPVMVLGGGRVGAAAAAMLKRQGVNVVIVDKRDAARVTDTGGVDVRDIPRAQGDAADLAVLEQAGIREAPAVIITTHDDDTNIYLTIYCRRLRPDIQIISRATLGRNVSILHAAGADLVLSLSSMLTGKVINLLSPGRVFMLNEGLDIFRVRVGEKLAGKTLMDSGIRRDTGCSVVAVAGSDGLMRVNPAPDYSFSLDEELYMVGDSRAEAAYYERYGHEDALSAPDMGRHSGGYRLAPEAGGRRRSAAKSGSRKHDSRRI